LGGASIVSTVESHLPLLKELRLAVDEVIHYGSGAPGRKFFEDIAATPD